jgi:Ca2+/Na+ antiporter
MPTSAERGNQPSGETGASHESRLTREGIDPKRVAIHRLGWPRHLLWHGYPPWTRPMIVGLVLWAAFMLLELLNVALPAVARSVSSLLIGLLILSTACDALITGAERIAARKRWDHYVAATLAEMLSTLPELVAISFVVFVSPEAALAIALVTIYNNAFVFSVYSYFLPKDHHGRYIMPRAVTEAGSQLLIAGAGLGSILGCVMLVLVGSDFPKQAFAAADLIVLGLLMLGIFGVYLAVLVRGYASEERAVREALELTSAEVAQRRSQVYEEITRTSIGSIALVLGLGVATAFIGGERISDFAATAIGELAINPIATAVLLAAFAGMSEYVILWRAHRKGQHRIALANAFGGITQVMFLVLPFTMIVIGAYQGSLASAHPELPLAFGHSTLLLFLLLFPTFFVLLELIQEDHTLGALDTAIMTAIFVLIITILLVYGA